jgi:predicted cupin superfamily sugar epimerase
MSVPDDALSAEEVVRRLDLKAHPEGGYFRETFRDAPGPDGRSRATCIYYLLAAGQRSAWHRIDAAEVWHFYAGAPLALLICEPGGPVRTHELGRAITAGELPQAVVPPHAWQAAESRGAWTLVGCTVAPGFLFETFELAPPGATPA